MQDYLRIHVLWHPQSTACEAYAKAISQHFDGLGMERDGVQYRIPVRFRSEGWNGPGAAPRPIDFAGSQHNAIIFLHDELTQIDKAIWDPYLEGILSALGERDCLIPFQMSAGAGVLASLARRHINYARQDRWATMLPDVGGRRNRCLLHVLHSLRTHFRALANITVAEPLFVSHAKMDGDGTARQIIDHINDSNQDVPLTTFYDAKELLPGEDFQRRFEHEIGGGTLLAIVSDLYDTRPWCIYELTTAKRARRPIVLADVGKVKTSRGYPYGANLPRVRLGAVEADTIEALLVEVLSEGLRCDLFQREAAMLLAEAGSDGLALPRPPELFDVVDALTLPSVLVYPDPPVGDIEQGILDKAFAQRGGGCATRTMGELATHTAEAVRQDALAGLTVALSVSGASDMARLGYPEREVDRALFSICGALVRGGGRLAYGGKFSPAGYTFKIFQFLSKAYAVRREVPPFIHFVPASALRQAGFDPLLSALRESSGVVETRAIGAGGVWHLLFPLEGSAIAARRHDTGALAVLRSDEDFAGWCGALGLPGAAEALTAMRRTVAAMAPVRVAMGGKTGVLDIEADRYSGAMPGVVEEVLATIEEGGVPIVLGAFGGAARDIAVALGLRPDSDLIARTPQDPSYAPALSRVASQANMIPNSLRGELSKLAAMDQTELLGHRIAALCRTIHQQNG